jgi:hypothetical protein
MIKKPMTQSCICDIPVPLCTDATMRGGVSLYPNKEYTLIIDYPFHKEHKFKIKSGKVGIKFLPLCKKIGSFYEKAYAEAEEDDSDDYWHGIGDLVIEGIHVDHKKRIVLLDMGS